MKHLLRKPLLPLLLLAMIVFADCFLVSFRGGILRDREQVENLYDNTLLTIELLPGENSGSRLRLPTHKKDFLEELAQVEHTLYVIECDALASDTPARLYGTNDLPRLVSHCSLAAPEGLSFSGGGAAIPCLVGTDLAAALALSPGDTLTVIPITSMGAYTDSAPHVPLTVLGIFSDPAFTMDSGIIVPEEIFLHGPKLLYNSDMMYDCFYRTYIMELDRAYNRDFEATEEAVEDILADRKQFELSSNYRTLRRVVGPLERKLAVQERLVVPLAVLFALAAAVCALLLARSCTTEIFLRLIWGEKRWAVFARVMGVLLLLLTLCAVTAAAAALCAAGSGSAVWAAGYAGGICLLCLLTAGLFTGRCCRKNLIDLYQSKEGE